MFYQPVSLGSNVEGAIVKFIRENNEWAFIEHNTNGCGLGELIKKDCVLFNALQEVDKYKNWQENSFLPIDSKY